MRKVVVSNVMSLDGFIAGPNGELDWHTAIVDDEFQRYAAELLATIDTILFGRVTYQLMEFYWPTATPEKDDPRIIDALNNYPKVVFSRTLKSAGWKNVRLVHRDPVEEVLALKGQQGKNIVIYGSGELVALLSQKGVIDDYRLIIAPVVLGGGKRMFGSGERLPLKLEETRKFGSGAVLLRYRPVRED